jgi:hypothetical protein
MSDSYSKWSDVKARGRAADRRTDDEQARGKAAARERREAYVRGHQLGRPAACPLRRSAVGAVRHLATLVNFDVANGR